MSSSKIFNFLKIRFLKLKKIINLREFSRVLINLSIITTIKVQMFLGSLQIIFNCVTLIMNFKQDLWVNGILLGIQVGSAALDQKVFMSTLRSWKDT